MKNTLIIGLTGGIGSGKSFVSEAFENFGIEVIDADLIARSVTQANQPAYFSIIEHFGQSIVGKQGELDRTQLRGIIFKDPGKKKWLEDLLHPIIREDIIHCLKGACKSYKILSSPLLFETKQNKLVDLVVTVDVPEELQITRVMSRDKCTPDIAKRIIDAQISRDERTARSDFIINNEGSKQDTNKIVTELHQQFLNLSTQTQLGEKSDD